MITIENKLSQITSGAIDTRAIWITNNLEIVADSRWVAFYLGKEHRHMLRDIRSLEECPNLGSPKFVWGEAPNSQNKMQPFVLMNYEAFDILIGSYTGDVRSRALGLKARFRELEQQLAYKRLLADPSHLMAVTKMYYEQTEKIQLLTEENQRLTETNHHQAEKIAQDASKVEFANKVGGSKTDVKMSTFAETVGLKLKDCHDWFMRKGYIIRSNGADGTPGYQVSAKGKELKPTALKTVQTPIATGAIVCSVNLTPVGQLKFHAMIMAEKKEGALFEKK